MNIKNLILSLFLFTFSMSCGSSGGDGGDKVIEGQLTQGPTDSHSEGRVKHGENEPIEEVDVCALGRCSKTDSEGMFGFSIPSDFKGGDILVTVNGHNTDAGIVVSFPDSVSTLFAHIQKLNSSELKIHHLMYDGVDVEIETPSDEHSH